ncbi:MAG TPA: cytidine deaminase [Flavobacteriales bacterium]|nr:cytidine deaminase [Flavobacteriales bacterium]
MDYIKFSCEIKSCSIEELDKEDQALHKAALESCEKAYAPYSKFYVGAAVRMNNGETIVANNQENMAYPSGMCAERIAVFQAKSAYPKSAIDTICITAKNDTEEPITSCGSCRQVMLEYEKIQTGPIKIIMVQSTGKTWISESVNNLLPFGFDLPKQE